MREAEQFGSLPGYPWAMNLFVPFVRPEMPDAESMTAHFESIAQSNWHTNFGPKERLFCTGIEEFIGSNVHAATASNATIGIMAALSALLPRGDGSEYIAIASFTFAAGADAIVWHGYKPAWIDVDAPSAQPSLRSFESLLESGTPVRGLILTNSFGIANPEVSRWEQIAASRNIPIVIDSAAGFGSRYPGGELLGARGDCEVFSFHATKPFAIGEGGAVVARDPEVIARVRAFTNFGFIERERGASALGLNGKLSEIAAAVGLTQLERFEEALEERRAVIIRYKEELDHSAIAFLENIELSSVGFAALLVDTTLRRDEILASLGDANVEAKAYYSPPVHVHPYFTRFRNSVDLSVTDSLASRALSLPVLPRMSEEEIERVCDAVKRCL